MFTKIWEKLKEVLRRMIGGKTIEKTLHVAPVMSSEMEKHIQLWADMYKNEAPWVHEPSNQDPTRVVSLGLPSLISSEKARTALIEWESEITTPTEEVEVDNPNYIEPKPDEFGNILPSVEPKTIIEEKPTTSEDRAKYLNEQYLKLKKQIRKQLEYGIAKGGLVIKPYPVISKSKDEKGKEITSAAIEFDFIQADSFYPLAFDVSGKITEAAFVQTKKDKDMTYRRLEYHKWEGSNVRIINKAFKSTNNQVGESQVELDLGEEIPLTSVPEWKDLQPQTLIKNVTKPLFAYFKMPEANTIDTNSPLGVSGYSRAIQLIKDADMQYSRLLWEYEAGEMAVNVDRDAFKWLEDPNRPSDGHSVLPKGQQRLYRQVDVNLEQELFQPYAPALRDSDYINGLNTILMRIEDAVALSRGTLSDVSVEARTATELKILKQRSYMANAEIQHALEDTLKDVIYIMNVYCTLYELTPEGEYDVNFEWDDSILVDVDVEITKRLTLLQNGLMSKLELRMWYFGETERQAEEALRKIQEETLSTMEDEMIMNQNETQFNNNLKEEE